MSIKFMKYESCSWLSNLTVLVMLRGVRHAQYPQPQRPGHHPLTPQLDSLPKLSPTAPPYVIGCLACFWCALPDGLENRAKPACAPRVRGNRAKGAATPDRRTLSRLSALSGRRSGSRGWQTWMKDEQQAPGLFRLSLWNGERRQRGWSTWIRS